MFNPAKQKAHPNSVLPRPTQLLLENLELQQTNNPEVQRYATLQVKGGKLVESFQFLDVELDVEVVPFQPLNLVSG